MAITTTANTNIVIGLTGVFIFIACWIVLLIMLWRSGNKKNIEKHCNAFMKRMEERNKIRERQ